ncbi:hypothetical protein QZH41_014893 [Actinostola sp. cb2023]|nr:hypothetical protein QZH41_014893 [Actinostola sp. cb2023]
MVKLVIWSPCGISHILQDFATGPGWMVTIGTSGDGWYHGASHYPLVSDGEIGDLVTLWHIAYITRLCHRAGWMVTIGTSGDGWYHGASHYPLVSDGEIGDLVTLWHIAYITRLCHRAGWMVTIGTSGDGWYHGASHYPLVSDGEIGDLVTLWHIAYITRLCHRAGWMVTIGTSGDGWYHGASHYPLVSDGEIGDLVTLWHIAYITRLCHRAGWMVTIGTSGDGCSTSPHQVPEFTIPLMLPMFIQSKLSADGDVFDPVKETCSLGSNAPLLVQLEGGDDDNLDDEETSSGPVIRRLESVMDVSMFPDQENDENRPEATGPWKSSRRESLFFPSLLSSHSTTPPTSDSAPSSPSKFGKRFLLWAQRRFTERKRTQSSCSSTAADQTGSIRSRISSDVTSIKRKITKPLLVKKTSCPESTLTAKLPLKKRFSEIHRRQISSDSLLGSIKSSKELPASKRGNLVLTMRHHEYEKKLTIYLVNATDLPMKNNNLLDTFARLYLIMPSKQLRQQSKVHKKTCNPIYDETFVFEDIDNKELLQSHLRIKILHKDGFSRGEMIGELAVDLSDENMSTGKTIQRTLLPRATSVTEDGPGELLVSVCHHATAAQLKVQIIKMRDLPKSCKSVPNSEGFGP